MNINIKDKNGNTPLANAILYKRIHFIDYLINHGADLHSINKNNKTIYELSAENINDYQGKIIFYKLKKYFDSFI